MIRLLRAVLALAAVPLGVAAYWIQVHDLHSPRDNAIAIVAAGWAFLIAGLVAWSRREENLLGPLMTAAAFALLARQLRYAHGAVLFTVFFALGDLAYALVGHSALAWPSGRVVGRLERAITVAGYSIVLAIPAAVLLFKGTQEPLIQFDPSPRESLIRVSTQPGVVEFLQKTEVVLFYGVIATLFIAVVARRLLVATPRARRIMAPLLVAAIVVALRAVFECIFTFAGRPAANPLFWWQIIALIALPLALLGGLLRARLARATVGDLLLELEHAPPERIRDALARALDDPTLQVAFWLPERSEFVDETGRRVELPQEGDTLVVTRLEHEGEPLAALIHDRSLLDEPRLVNAAGAAARMALENARLHAEMRAQLAEVQASRVRIVAAADEERRKIERDIHDGAQQRLVALGLQLRSAQRRLGTVDPEVDQLLASAMAELQLAVGELRELARGVHPAILTEEGLGAALESLVTRSPFPVSLDGAPEQRLAPEVEATAYFVACEGLTNIVKHAQASKASITARRLDGLLVIEVEDDGAGGANASNGSGLRGLTDRVEALGGRLNVESAAGAGTRIVAEIPCAS